MKEKLSHLKIPHYIIFIGCIITIFSILSFMGQGLKLIYDGEVIDYQYSSVFNYMFGTNDAYKIPGLVFVFVFELFAIFLSLTLIVLCIANVIDRKYINIISILICVFLIVALILCLCIKSFILSKTIEIIKESVPSIFIDVSIEEAKKLFTYIHISTGPIVYAVMSSLSIVTIISGIALLNINLKKK